MICSRRDRATAITAVALILLLAVLTEGFVPGQTNFIPTQQNQFGMAGLNCNRRVINDYWLSRRQYSRFPTNVVMKSATSDTEMEAEITKMRVKEIRDELESYGINTKSFLEKSELADALLAARKEGKAPIKDENEASTATTKTSASTHTKTSDSAGNRQEKLQEEMEKCKSMKVSDLKKELESYGLSTKSYFEKSEFVRAVAEARVDGVTKTSGGSASGGAQKEDPRDPSFRDVSVSKFSGDSKMGLGGTVIDVKAR